MEPAEPLALIRPQFAAEAWRLGDGLDAVKGSELETRPIELLVRFGSRQRGEQCVEQRRLR